MCSYAAAKISDLSAFAQIKIQKNFYNKHFS